MRIPQFTTATSRNLLQLFLHRRNPDTSYIFRMYYIQVADYSALSNTLLCQFEIRLIQDSTESGLPKHPPVCCQLGLAVLSYATKWQHLLMI